MPGGRPKARYSQALRLLQIVDMLQHRGRVTIPQLCEEFGIDRRTVQRDVGVLMENYSVEEGERTSESLKTFCLKPGTRSETLKLTQPEMVGLYLGRNLFAFTEGTLLKGAVDSLYGKLQARLSARDAQLKDTLPKKLHCTVGFPKSYQGSDDAMNDLLTGLLRDRKVAITYRAPGGRPYDDVIHPYTLVLHNHALYVICFSERADDRRVLALERIETSKWLRDTAFAWPQDYDPADYLATAFGISAGKTPETVRLLFSAKVAPYVVARMWHPSMKHRQRRDGSVELSMSVYVGEELVHWTTGYGGEVTVLAPETLRDAVRQRHEQALGSRR